MNIKEEIARRTDEIESILVGYLPEESGYQKTVIEAMNYSFLAGGKRLRPMLMQETYRLFGGCDRIVVPFMAAIEMIHTYSLIHDDLPALDNDDYRRGRKTTHIVYGEAMGILAGDGLLNLAYETALNALEQEPGNPRVAGALRILARGAGIYGMLGGQVADVEAEGQTVDQDKLDFIYDRKTGALIESSMLIGAVLAGADDSQQEMIVRAAADVGLAFQIQDDILDVAGDQALIGKPVGSDEKNQKTTYVTLRGLEAASEDVERLLKRAIDVLRQLPVQNEFLIELLRYLIQREK